jgi:GNAT superfamily N-acetyltransferase
MNNVVIRKAERGEAGLISEMIHELAAYEKLSHECSASEELLDRHLFGAHPAAEAFLALADGQPAGFALCFQNFSTFLSRPGLYLEDLFVRPPLRRRGIARALLQHLAAVAQERGYGRLEWSVLDWNKDAIRFYESLGAKCLQEWRIFRVTGPGIGSIASGAAMKPGIGRERASG